MTARANSLTERVRRPTRPTATQWWSMPGKDLRVMIDAFARLGYDVGALAGSVRLGSGEDGSMTIEAEIPCGS